MGSGRRTTVGATTVYTCPSNKFAWASQAQGGYGGMSNPVYTNGAVMGDNTGRWPRSYGYNCSLFTAYNNAPKITDIRNASWFILIIETRLDAADLGPWWISGGDEGQDGYVWGGPSGRFLGDGAMGTKYGKYQSHRGGMNFTFCDGHASYLKLVKTISDPQMWNPRPQGAYAANPGACYLNKIPLMLPEYR